MYFFWLGFYFLACIFIIVMIFVYFDDYQVTVHKDTFRVAVQRSFIALQYLYLVATLAKITGLFTLYFYNPNTQSAAHDAAAGTAFVAAVCCSLFMLIRRAIIVCVHESHAASKISPSINEPLLEKSTEDEFIKKREEFEKRKNWNQILIIITVLSSLFLATELGLLISLLPDGPRDGRVEFCLVFFNVFDNFWLIAEFHLDPQGLDRYVIFRRYTR